MKGRLRQGLVASLLASVLGLTAFLRMPGSENVRVVQIVALLAAGMGLGVALMHAKLLLASRSQP
jgi:hypothetical protein